MALTFQKNGLIVEMFNNNMMLTLSVPAAQLTHVTLGPVRCLDPVVVHVPDHEPAVLPGGHQAGLVGAVHEAGHLAPVTVQLIHRASPPANVPHEHAAVVTPGVQPVLDPVPGETLDTAAMALMYNDIKLID